MHRNFLYGTVFVTGLVILMLEVLGSRVMGPFFGISLYIWASLISVTLIALSIGYWLGGRIADIKAVQKLAKESKKAKPGGRIADINTGWGFLYSIILFSAVAILFIQFISAPLMEWSYNLFGIKLGVLLSALIVFSVPLLLLGMASPYVIRLLVTETGRVGGVAGGVFAISTLGSVIGALLTAFVLIPNLGVSRAFTLGSLLLLSLSGIYFFTSRKYYQVLITLLITAISLYLLFFYQKTLAKDDVKQIIYQTDTLYGQLKVVEFPGSDIRATLIDGAVQGIVYRDNSHDLPYMVYVKLFIQLLSTYQKNGGDVLIIGLGAGEIPRFLSRIGYRSDVVEIDPKVELMAVKYFDFNKEFGKVIIDDGRRYIRNCGKKYDLIFLDVASGGTQPWYFFTKEAFQEMAKILKPDGILGINFLGFYQGEKSKTAISINKTLKTVFRYSDLYATKYNPGALKNLLFFASDKPLAENLEREKILENLKVIKLNFNLQDGIVLTDNYNPLDLRSIDVSETVRKMMFKWLGGKFLR